MRPTTTTKRVLPIFIMIMAVLSPAYAKDFAIENGTMTLLNVTGTPGNIFLVPSSGSVGIGTTVISQLLTVAGNANITGTLYASNFFGNGENLTGIGNTNVSILYGANQSNTSQILPARLSADGNLMFSIQEGTGAGWDRTAGKVVLTTLTDSVGIGTTTPSQKLHVGGTGGNSDYGLARFSPTAANGEATIGFFSDVAATDTNDAWVIGNAGWTNTGDFVIGNENNGAGGNVRLLIEKSGNVGIGTTSPGAKLDVSGGNIVLDNARELTIRDSGGTIRGLLGWTSGNEVQLQNNALGTGGDIAFYTGGVSPDVIIKNSGNVGIGTTTPTATFEVNGTIKMIPRASATCNAAAEGSMFYNATDKHFYGCNSTTWLRIDTTYS